jgi:hypothetical protein
LLSADIDILTQIKVFIVLQNETEDGSGRSETFKIYLLVFKSFSSNIAAKYTPEEHSLYILQKQKHCDLG